MDGWDKIFEEKLILNDTYKGNQNFNEKSDEVLTSDFIKNILINPNDIWGCEFYDEVRNEEKIPLVVLPSHRSNFSDLNGGSNSVALPSHRSNFLDDSTGDNNESFIGDDEVNSLSNGVSVYGNELYDSAIELIRFVELYLIINKNNMLNI